MRYLVTFLLVLAVVVAAAWLTFGDRVLTVTGLRSNSESAASAAVPVLDQLTPNAVRKIDLTPPGEPTLTLTRTANGTWTQAGNWPVRQAEANALVNTLTGLNTRFVPVRLEGDPPDLTAYGLADDQTPAKAVVQIDDRAVTLTFGRPKTEPGESPFARPTFVRVDDTLEVLQLGPDVYAVVSRAPESYRRRQLFPDAERVVMPPAEVDADPTNPAPASAGRVPLFGDEFRSIRVESSDADTPAYTLVRTGSTPQPRRDPDRPSAEPTLANDALAAVWELDTTATNEGKSVEVRDRVEPAKLRSVLTAMADLWVEKFVSEPADQTGLAAGQPAYTITVTRTDGRETQLELGKVSRTETKTEEQPPASPFAPPPPPPKTTTEEYRYAKLAGSDLVFEVRSDALDAAFAPPAELRDDRLARFDPANVRELTVTRPGEPPIVLTKKSGDEAASDADAQADRWYVGPVLADPTQVTELLESLSNLQAPADSRTDAPTPEKLAEVDLGPDAGIRVAVTVAPKTAEGEPDAKPRTITYRIGKDDTEAKKLAVVVDGWPRLNLVDDAVAALVARPGLAYRSRRLFDTAAARLDTVTVSRPGADAYALAETPAPDPAQPATWALTAPISTPLDASKAVAFTGDLARLEAVEYVDDAPMPADLEMKYGLTKPRYTVNLGFSGAGEPRVLRIGSTRDGTDSTYARLGDSGSVFTVANPIVRSLEDGALALLPTAVWSTPPEQITGVEIRRGPGGDNESYRLTRGDAGWKLTGPLDAAVGIPQVQPLLDTAGTLTAEKYVALTAADPAKYGFDKPELRLSLTYTEPPVNPDKPVEPKSITRTVIVGKSTAANAATRFARLDDPKRPSVFVIPDALAETADQPALSWLDRDLLSLDPSRVVKVQIDGPKPADDVTLSRGEDGDWKAEGATFAVDTATIADVVFTASRLPVDQLAGYGSGVDWNKYGLAKPTHTITLTLKPAAADGSPETHRLQLGKAGPSGGRFVRVDDGPAVGVIADRIAGDLTRDKLAFVDHIVFRFDPATLTGIVRTEEKDGKTTELAVEQTGLSWQLTKPAKEKADQPTLDQLAAQLGRLRAVSIAAFDPKPAQLKTFGLADPTAVVTLKVGLESPADRVLKLGGPVDAKSSAAGRYAVAVPADAKTPMTVAVIPGSLADQLLAGPLGFRDKSLAKFVDADKITLIRGDRKVTFAKVGGTWKVTEPIVAEAEQAAIDELINTVARLRADELVADKPKELKEYGLADPAAMWTFSAGGKELLGLTIGSAEKESGRVYAKAVGSDLVALLGAKASDQLTAEYRKRDVFTDLDASMIAILAVSGADGGFVLRKGPDGNWTDPTDPKAMIDPAKVTETLGALATVQASPYVADKDAKLELYGLKEPKRVLVATQRNGVTKTLQLGGPVADNGGKQVYGRAVDPGRSDVFVLSPEATAALNRDKAAYRAK